ncbi:MAG: hypothetical protein AB1508_00380 [Pseudomonadota bacterium]
MAIKNANQQGGIDANRDKPKWSNPGNFDVSRSGSAEHPGFGSYGYQCVGNNLARPEIRAASWL